MRSRKIPKFTLSSKHCCIKNIDFNILAASCWCSLMCSQLQLIFMHVWAEKIHYIGNNLDKMCWELFSDISGLAIAIVRGQADIDLLQQSWGPEKVINYIIIISNCFAILQYYNLKKLQLALNRKMLEFEKYVISLLLWITTLFNPWL